jgi:hypothetical protein
MLKHFTIIEIGADAESPMVGTITYIPETKQGADSFNDRLKVALKEHFDTDEIMYHPIPDLFTGSPYIHMEIKVPVGESVFIYNIRIMETWIY